MPDPAPARSFEADLTGIGMVLPGRPGACTDPSTFWSVLRDGTCCLTPLERQDLGVRVAGQVRGWDAAAELGLDPRAAGRMSRAALLATGAVGAALRRAGLAAADLDERCVLVGASLQYAIAEQERYHAALAAGGLEALRFGYWMTGTSPSVLGTVAQVLGISCPTLSVTGSCNVALRALDVAGSLFRAGDVERVVLVGVDTVLDRVYAASTATTSRQGYRASSLSPDPDHVRPHDEYQDGNAVSEGAVAVVLERPAGPVPPARPAGHVQRLRLHVRSSRSNGPSVVTAGPPDGLVTDVVEVLRSAGRSLRDVAFVNDYADGNRFVEDHFCAAVRALRRRTGYTGALRATNQEAAFGHASGTCGLIKLVGTVLMLQRRQVAPVTNCRVPYRDLPVYPVLGTCSPLGPHDPDAGLVLSVGAGGDATALLVEHLSGGILA